MMKWAAALLSVVLLQAAAPAARAQMFQAEGFEYFSNKVLVCARLGDLHIQDPVLRDNLWALYERSLARDLEDANLDELFFDFSGLNGEPGSPPKTSKDFLLGYSQGAVAEFVVADYRRSFRVYNDFTLDQIKTSASGLYKRWGCKYIPTFFEASN